jgi:hypothetical protein
MCVRWGVFTAAHVTRHVPGRHSGWLFARRLVEIRRMLGGGTPLRWDIGARQAWRGSGRNGKGAVSLAKRGAPEVR